MKTVRWGIVGCGDVTERKSGPAFNRVEGSSLVAVMRRDAKRAEDYARRHGVPRWYDDADALIQDPGVDAVYIATPPGAHLDLALRVASAGKPAYVEKPMARSHAECLAMNEAFAKAGLPLFVAYYRRALPRFIALRGLLSAGEIGEVVSVHLRQSSPQHLRMDGAQPPWRVDAAISGGGIFLDLGSHALDIVDFLLGPLDRIHGRAFNRSRRVPVEDTVHMQFVTAGGVPGTGQWEFAAEQAEDRLEIRGTQGTLGFSVFGFDPLVLESPEGTRVFEHPVPDHVQEPLIATVVSALRGSGSCPSTGTSAARTSRVMDLVLSEYYGGREDDFWSRSTAWPGASGS